MQIQTVKEDYKKVILFNEKLPLVNTEADSLYQALDLISITGYMSEEGKDYCVWKLDKNIPSSVIYNLAKRLGYEQ